MDEKYSKVIITGTDPNSRRGGIGFALPGYLSAMDHVGLHYVSVPTYHPSAAGGKWRNWLAAFPKLFRAIGEIYSQGGHGHAIVYSHSGAGISLFREFFVLAFCRALGAETVLQIHAPEVDGYLSHPFKRILFRFAISPAMALGVLTQWWKVRISSEGIVKPLFIIPNPLPEEWENRAKLQRPLKPSNGKIVLLSLSRLVPGKGIDLAIEAMPYLPDIFELVVAGDGSLRQKMKQRVEALSISHRVHFSGWVAGDEKQRLMDEADVFVLPTTYDSFGMGFMEAMANGLPVVAAEWGAIPDVVPDGRCGVLVRELTPQAVAEAILTLRDTETRQRMGIESKAWVLERFSPEVVGNEIKVMIESVAKK